MSAAIINENSSHLLQRHLSHEHGLVLQEFSENCSTFKCSICMSSVKGGLAYHCPDCNDFFLHKYCAELPSVIQQHLFRPKHQLELILKNDVKDTGFCSWMSLKRYHYQCHECKILLHLECAASTLPTRKHKHKEDEETIQHIAHEHPLESFYMNNSPYSYYCGCRNKISCRAYGCRACIFVLHASCTLSPQEINTHPLHPKHPLTLVVDMKITWYDCSRFVYHCIECDFNLDMGNVVHVERHHISIPQDERNSQNSKDRQEIHHFFRPHPLTYCYTKGYTSLACDLCQEKITGDIYVCGDCSFMLHKSCADFPQDIVHPLHPHHHLILQTADLRGALSAGTV